MKPVIIFAAETINLAEVTRMLEIAKVAQRTFQPVFLSYDGDKRNHLLIEGEGFPVVLLEPTLDAKAVERFWKFDRMEAFGDFFSKEDLEKRVRSEIELYERWNPVAVVTGFCLSTNISARVANIPLVWIAQSTWLLEYAKQFGAWPDFADWPLTRILPDMIRDKLGRMLTPAGYWLWSLGINQVAKKYGIRSFHGSGIFEGDYMLFAEPENFSGVEIPERLKGKSAFVGPLIARLPIDIPDEILNLPRDLPIVYFAMGSSGIEDIVRDILFGFANQPYRVIAPVGQLLKGARHTSPGNVIATDWLPADKVNAMADISVLHGGIGTLFTACLAGTPIVGIPNGNPEQEYNLSCLVRKGFAVHLSKKRLTTTVLLHHINELLNSQDAKENCKRFQTECATWNGPERTTQFLEQHFLR